MNSSTIPVRPRGFGATLARPDVHILFGLLAGLVYAFGLWRRLWFTPELVRAVLWLALPLAAWTALRMLVYLEKPRTALVVAVIAYPSCVGGLLALVALSLPLWGERASLVVDNPRWTLGAGPSRSYRICHTTMTGSTPGLLEGSEFSFCADAFPRPIFRIPPVQVTVTKLPYAAWLHQAWPAEDDRQCDKDPALCRTPR